LDLLIYMQEAIHGFYLSLYYFYWETQAPHWKEIGLKIASKECHLSPYKSVW
jgi:hypothetical protein